tara:strand:- start:23333 stop:24742 length:1410 start_codon:yes stop_codon:yes gene_type:complete
MGIKNSYKIRAFLFLITFIFVNQIQSQTDFIIHKVRKNQDIEKIAMIYEIDVNIILEFNPNTEIKKGAKLKIPRSFSYGQENNEDLEIPEIQDTNEIENEIIYDSLIENITNYEKKRVAIMLPFRTKNINFDSVKQSKEIIKNDKLLSISLDFLFGIEMAVDSFSKFGIDVDISVFDTGADKNIIHELIKENDFTKYDLLIGPLTTNAFNYVSKSLSSDLKIVSPLSKSKLDYQNIIHTIPNDELLFNKITSFIKRDTVPSQKFIISDSYNRIVSEKIKKIFPDANQFFSEINDSGIDTRTMVYDSLDSTFVKGRNIVFLETRDQGFVSNITSILNSFVNDTTEIILTTTNKNRAFEGINISNYYMSNLNFHYPSINRSITNYREDSFVKKYFMKYNTYPSKYSFRGHDLVLDLLIRLSCGELDYNNLNLIESEYIENKFKYIKDEDGIYRNISSYIMKFDDLKFVEIE